MPRYEDPYRQWQEDEQTQAGAPQEQAAVEEALSAPRKGRLIWDPVNMRYTREGQGATPLTPTQAAAQGKVATSTSSGWGWSPEGQKKTFDFSLPANYSYAPAPTRGQYMGQGWMYDRMDNTGDTAMKYLFARAAETIDPTQPGAAQAVAQRMKELYGLDVQVNGDVITFPQTGERIDVLRGAQGTPSGYDVWQWMDLNDIDKEQAQAAATSAAGGGQVSALLPEGYNWAGQSPNDLLRMVMSRLALNRVLWDNPMNMRF